MNQSLHRVKKLKGGKFVARDFPSNPNGRGLVSQQTCTDSKGKAVLHFTYTGHASFCDSPIKDPVMPSCIALERK